MSDACQSALQRLTEGAVPVVVHPLGFACMRIRDGLCVHAWLPGEPELEPTVATSPIHCHRWNLTSLVVAGEVGNVVWEIRRAAPADASHRVYDVRVTPGGDAVKPTRTCVTAVPGIPEYAGPGESYVLPAGVFHDTIVGEPTVTLLTAVREPGVRDRALGPLRLTGNRVARRRPASPTLTAQVADLAIRTLKEHL